MNYIIQVYRLITISSRATVRVSQQTFLSLFFTYILPCILIIIKDFSPNDAQLDSLKNNFKFALQLTLKSSHIF